MRIVSTTLAAVVLLLLLFCAAGCETAETQAQREVRINAENARRVKVVGAVAVGIGLLVGIAIGSVRRSKPNGQ